MPTEMNSRAVLLGLFSATAVLGEDDTYDLLATLIGRNEQRVGSTEYHFAARPR